MRLVLDPLLIKLRDRKTYHDPNRWSLDLFTLCSPEYQVVFQWCKRRHFVKDQFSENTSLKRGCSKQKKKRLEQFSLLFIYARLINPGMVVDFLKGIFKYRKTSLTLFVLVTVVTTVFLTTFENSLEYTVQLPSSKDELEILNASWLDLQEIAKKEHTYGSTGNDFVHDYLEKTIEEIVSKKPYIESDNDLDYTNNLLYYSQFSNPKHLIYYESNNLVVRVNGTNSNLPALLLSAHYDSVPTSTGVTDDGMGIASMLGTLRLLASNQPERTVIFNFNNDEEFGLNGANAFLHHPWHKQVKYFLNLEGTGAGGKAILFRGTDYGIVKYFKGARYPFASSLFQMGFHNGLVHSETDYVVYRDRGNLRGLDVAFYKPRDIYHTKRDNINSINIKSLWHMLSISLDFVRTLDTEVDLDTEELGSGLDYAVFTSILNFFVAFPTSKVVQVNIALLVLVPLLSIPLLFVVLNYRKNWSWNFVNFVKFPLSLVLSTFVLSFASDFIASQNEFIVNSSIGLVFFTMAVTFALTNLVILNGINLIFSRYEKIINHDEKLITLIQISFINWVALIWSTYKLSHNKLGDDHTGEFFLLLLFVLQAVGVLFGLIGWSFTKSTAPVSSEEAHPLLDGEHSTYGTEDASPDEASSTSSSLTNLEEEPIKYLSYDWLPQFLVTVPLSSLVIYKAGNLIMEGLNKTPQESLNGEHLLYKFIQVFAITWVIPFLPFIFKFNRIIFTVLLVVSLAAFVFLSSAPAFNELNPLKLRFYQSIDLTSPTADSFVHVRSRHDSPAYDILADLPSVKKSNEKLSITALGDGMEEIAFKTDLIPFLAPNVKSPSNYIKVDVLKNSSSNNPFGLLTGEIKIQAPKNRLCNLSFNTSDATSEFFNHQSVNDSPVKTVIIYASPKNVSSSSMDFEESAIPEGFSLDKYGNYIYKNLNGIDDIQLKKLNWDTEYHIGFQWAPSIVDIDSVNIEKVLIHKLGINVQCLWADLTPLVDNKAVQSPIPAFDELLHYSPNYVTYANALSGLVAVADYVEI